MTSQANFKRRIRDRMAKTGERYNAARRALIEAAGPRARTWHSEPEMSEAAVLKGTGRGWDAWCDLIDAWPGHVDGHKAIATWLRETHGVGAWWAQGVTGGYERITGLRLPGQMPDGTFTANKSKTMDIDAAELRAALLDDAARQDLFPGLETELRSRPTSKAIRVRIGPGAALFAIDAAKGRTKVTVAHEKLPSADDVPEWKFYWGEWLDALADQSTEQE